MPEKKGRIVVVDDDVQLVESVTTLLESVGYEVFSAHRAEKGFDLAKEKQPDLILLDVMFAGPPGPDGIEISRRIRKDPKLKDTPVVMLSGVKKVLELGYDMTPDESFMPVEAFIDKPVKPEELLTTIDEVLESKVWCSWIDEASERFRSPLLRDARGIRRRESTSHTRNRFVTRPRE